MLSQQSFATDPDVEPPVDGRRARSQSSRSKIVAALLNLVGNGDVAPSAAQVAGVAGVGLRSVFRHFEDMDALYRGMTEAIEARVRPFILQDPAGDSWKERLGNLVDRRARVYEAILPYRISANLRRFESDYLMQDYRRMLALESASLAAQLPDAIKEDQRTFRVLEVILSFQTWRSLRHDQQLGVDDARAVVHELLDGALARLPD